MAKDSKQYINKAEQIEAATIEFNMDRNLYPSFVFALNIFAAPSREYQTLICSQQPTT